jgi:hypothetical protein
MGNKRQSGQAIVLVALMLVAIAGLAALAIDVGNGMSDRRDLQGAADMAALAGASSYGSGSDAAHFVALEYTGRATGVALPLAGCSSGSCPSGTYDEGDYRFTVSDAGAAIIDVTIERRVTAWFGGVVGIPRYSVVASARAMSTSRFTASPYALMGLSGDVSVFGGGSTKNASVGGSVYSAGSFGTNNAPHQPVVSQTQTDGTGKQCPGAPPNRVDLGGTSNSLDFLWAGGTGPTNFSVAPVRLFDGQAPTTKGPTFTRASDARNPVTGHWMPGLYQGIYPSGGLLDPGVYVIVNVGTGVAIGAIANAIPAPRGQADPAGAVSIVLDGSDLGALDISNAVLNGIDDLGGANAPPPRDPLGTHNFAIYASGFRGPIDFGPGTTTDITGITYAPDSNVRTNGNAGPIFTGSAIFASVTTLGGGNGLPTYNWVCGLGSVAGPNAPGSPGALVR